MSESKTPVVRAPKIALGMKCGDCLHYNICANPAVGREPCSKLGVGKKANAPAACYAPNIYALTDENPQMLRQLGLLMKCMKPSTMRVLAFVLTKNSRTLEQYGLSFGQPVYFSVSEDYLSHYFKGYVAGHNEFGVIIAASLNKAQLPTTCVIPRESLYTLTQFKVKRQELVQSGRIAVSEDEIQMLRLGKTPLAQLIDENGKVPHVEEIEDVDYVPPHTIDDAPDSWWDVFKNDTEQVTTSRAAKKTGNKRKRKIPTAYVID